MTASSVPYQHPVVLFIWRRKSMLDLIKSVISIFPYVWIEPESLGDRWWQPTHWCLINDNNHHIGNRFWGHLNENKTCLNIINIPQRSTLIGKNHYLFIKLMELQFIFREVFRTRCDPLLSRWPASQTLTALIAKTTFLELVLEETLHHVTTNYLSE